MGQENFNSFLPTVKFKSLMTLLRLTFFVEEKYSNEIKNIFLRDDKNVFNNISSNQNNQYRKL